MQYTPPTPADLRALKEQLGYTGEQMAELFGLAGGQQWRKYTGGADPRDMSAQMLLFAAARLTLTQAQMNALVARMRAIGAQVELDPLPTAA